MEVLQRSKGPAQARVDGNGERERGKERKSERRGEETETLESSLCVPVRRATDRPLVVLSVLITPCSHYTAVCSFLFSPHRLLSARSPPPCLFRLSLRLSVSPFVTCCLGVSGAHHGTQHSTAFYSSQPLGSFVSFSSTFSVISRLSHYSSARLDSTMIFCRAVCQK